MAEDEKWVDIGAPTEEWEGYQPCGRSKGCEEKVSKVRATCKSQTDDKVAKGECCQTKKS